MQLKTRFRRSALLLLAAGMVVAGGAVGTAASGQAHLVVLGHGKFEPAEIKVAAGDTVTWRNDDVEDPQSVTADDGSFDSHPQCSEEVPERCMGAHETFSLTFTSAGRVRYYSRTEGGPGGEGMSGVVIVK